MDILRNLEHISSSHVDLRRYKQVVDDVTPDAGAKEKAPTYSQKLFTILIDHKNLS